MAFNSEDLSLDYTIKVLSGSISRSDRSLQIVVPSTATSATITISGTSYEIQNEWAGEVLRISDGTTTIDYTGAYPAGYGDHEDADKFSIGSGRTINDMVTELVDKINASALDITATHNGGAWDSMNVSFTLVPGAGKSLTITEDPNGDGAFAGYDVAASVSLAGGAGGTFEYDIAPFRFSSPGVFNLRNQGGLGTYRTFTGNQKS